MKNVILTRSRRQPDFGLSAREQEVLALAVKGLSRPEIARRHGVEASTVCAQMKSIYRKLGVHNRAGAVAKAVKRGLVDDLVPAGAGRVLPSAGTVPGWRSPVAKAGRRTDEALNCPHCGGGLHLLPVAGGPAARFPGRAEGQNFQI